MKFYATLLATNNPAADGLIEIDGHLFVGSDRAYFATRNGAVRTGFIVDMNQGIRSLVVRTSRHIYEFLQVPLPEGAIADPVLIEDDFIWDIPTEPCGEFPYEPTRRASPGVACGRSFTASLT